MLFNVEDFVILACVILIYYRQTDGHADQCMNCILHLFFLCELFNLVHISITMFYLVHVLTGYFCIFCLFTLISMQTQKDRTGLHAVKVPLTEPRSLFGNHQHAMHDTTGNGNPLYS